MIIDFDHDIIILVINIMFFVYRKAMEYFMDYYSETVVKNKLNKTDYLKISGIIILGAVFAYLSFFLLSQFFIILMAVDLYGMYYLLSQFDREYEYCVTNGELDIDIIISKKRRKKLANIKAREFLIIAPYSEKHQHKIKSAVKRIEAPKSGTHFAIYQKAAQKNCVFFSPNEKMLENLKANVNKGVLLND